MINTGKLEGKIAIVTGAASGLGKAIAHRFASEGAKVIIADLLQEAGKTVANALTDGLFLKVDVSVPSEPDALRQAMQNMNPIPGMPTPEDVASAALFLASDEARFITGVALPVDGGYTAR